MVDSTLVSLEVEGSAVALVAAGHGAVVVGPVRVVQPAVLPQVVVGGESLCTHVTHVRNRMCCAPVHHKLPPLAEALGAFRAVHPKRVHLAVPHKLGRCIELCRAPGHLAPFELLC